MNEFILKIRKGYYDDKDDLVFQRDCEIYHGFHKYPDEVKAKIHSVAYDRGHSWGLESIANSYPDLLELVRLCKGM